MADKPLMQHVGDVGGAMVGAFAGWQLTQFKPAVNIAFETHLAPVVKGAGWVLIGWSAYSLVRQYILKAQ